MIIAIIEKELEGVSRGGTYIRDDVERTVWIYNPLRLPLPSTFVFKQYETAHPYSTWGAELVGGQCQEVFFGTALKDRLPEKYEIWQRAVDEANTEFTVRAMRILRRPIR